MGAFIRILFLLVLIGLTGVLPGLRVAAQTPPPTLRIPRVSRPPKLADFLGGDAREAEATVTDFRQRDPGDGVPVSEPTTVHLSYDNKNLYVVFVCKDEPNQVRARMAKREDAFSDDLVGVLLDTFHDRRRAYYFLSNPLGIQADAILTEGQEDDYSFDTLWHSEGRLTPDGYIVWMAIPFKSLRFSGEPVQTWGIALSRTIVRKNENSWWPLITRRVQGVVQQLANLEGLEGVSPGRNLQFIPYGQFARARFLDTVDLSNPLFRTQNDFRGGLDAKFVARDALTFDMALNPDFSQVESDEPQVTINQRFEVFFPEKRPFFIENAGFFQTPVTLFFSRRIADPQFGGRMTGKVGRWALGVLAIDDRGPGLGRLASDPLSGDRAGISVVRVEREFGQQSKIGLFVSSRDFAASSNRVFSLDTRLKLSPNWALTAQAIRSYTHNLSGTSRAGPAYWTELVFSGRHFAYAGRYNDISPNFHTDLGFVPRVDIRQTDHAAAYFWRPVHGVVTAFGPSTSALVNWNRQGQVQDWSAVVGFQVFLTGQTALQFSRGEAFELFQNLGFRKHSASIQFSTEWLKWLTFSAAYAQGTREDFFPPSPLLPFLARSRSARLGFTLRPRPRFRFDQTYFYTRLGAREGSTPTGFPSGANIFNNHILRSKLNYQFTRELSVRAIFDYNATLANPNLVDLQTTLGSFPGGPLIPTKRFTADFLLTYLLNPGTALYIGYTDRYDNRVLEPGMPPSLQFIRSPSTSTGRQLFIKVSYLFRF